MAAYTGIQGQNILIVSSDPANPTEGQIWYNTTSNLLKGYQYIAGSWASGGNLPTANRLSSGFGVQTDAVNAAGFGTTVLSSTSKYNGTSWTGSGNVNTGRYALAASGNSSSTAGLIFGGDTGPGTFTNATEKYNGTSWTNNPTGLNTARAYNQGAGVQTAALSMAGYTPPAPPTITSVVESFNGTTWTNTTSLPGPRTKFNNAASGTQTAALYFGSGNTDSFNGSSWTALNNMNTSRFNIAGAGNSTTTLAFGGFPAPAAAATESWDGTSWRNETSLSLGRDTISAAGNSNTTSLGFGGSLPGGVSQNATEEWTGIGFTTRTITTS
jgi:hypothetical protein